MTKIDLTSYQNKTALWMICEAIGENRSGFNFKPDENGLYDLSITLNGDELDVNRFIDQLQKSYETAVKKAATEMVQSEYGSIIDQIHNINETLKNHDKIFKNEVPNIDGITD